MNAAASIVLPISAAYVLMSSSVGFTNFARARFSGVAVNEGGAYWLSSSHSHGAAPSSYSIGAVMGVNSSSSKMVLSFSDSFSPSSIPAICPEGAAPLGAFISVAGFSLLLSLSISLCVSRVLFSICISWQSF